MKMRKLLSQTTAIVAAGQAISVAALLGVFFLLGKFDISVLLGGIAGGALAFINFLLMFLSANLAADKAEAQDVTGGQKLIQISYMGRMIGIALILFLCGSSGYFHLLTLVIPLVFTRPILVLSELIKKKGGGEK